MQLQVVAVVTASPLLSQFQESRRGSLCNQAIMLITDGAVEDYEPVFEKYNWPDRKVTPAASQGREGLYRCQGRVLETMVVLHAAQPHVQRSFP